MSNLGLLTLPNEILLIIFSHFEDPYPLYPLSTTCRRLHFLALPIYGVRTGVLKLSDSMTESYNIMVGPEETTALAALQTSLFLDTVDNLNCTFSNPHSQIRDLGRFYRLCSILTSIDSTNLRFRPPSFDDYHGPIQEIYYFDSIIHALNMVLEKSCTTLTVGAVPSDKPGSRRRARAARGAPSGGVLTSSISLSTAALRQRKLSEFGIHSDILVSPHCRAWTVEVLNSFPITSLSIDAYSVPTDVWDNVLTQTEIPTLSDLSIADCRVAPARMHAFLSRHPSVTTLHFGMVFVPSLQERLPPDHLPRLRVLSAPAAQVAYLLQALEHTAALRTVRVHSHMTRLDLIFTDTSLRSVESRLAPVALSLVLPVPANLPHLAVDLDLEFGDETALKYVSTLEFVFEDVNVAFFKLSDYLSITKWFAPFPGLKTVALVGFNDSYNIALVLEAIGLRANVEVLGVNGFKYDLMSSGQLDR
ncbi:hypothetical protein DFH07DRAFT_836078 [Mycena maculata]|uniref:F-box domain-containing protein n=1 Tax=Mycena maculata TaxID=230809 RepID=A0AAD7II04_9AGAR|nr:hypothetical protein DFH07DRAFT_836078 [Mycena maculata]